MGKLFNKLAKQIKTEQPSADSADTAKTLRNEIEKLYEGGTGYEEVAQRISNYSDRQLSKKREAISETAENIKAKYYDIYECALDDETAMAMASDFHTYKKLFKIKMKPYLKADFYNMCFEDRLAAIEKDGSIRKRADRYGIERMAEKLGKSKLEIIREYSDRIDELGVTFAQFNYNEMYKMTSSMQAIRADYLNKKTDRINKTYDAIIESMGISKKELKQRIRDINSTSDYKVNTMSFYNLELDKKSDEEIAAVLQQAHDASALGKKLRIFLDDVKFGKIDFSEVEESLNEMYDLCKVFVTERRVEGFKDLYSESIQETMTQEDLYQRFLDYMVTNLTLSFSTKEYVAFGFADKSFVKRLEYVSDAENRRLIAHMTTDEARDLLNDKYKTYEIFKKWYRREILLVKDKSDYDTFEKFFDSHDSFVKKSLTGAMGKEVELIITEDEDADELFERFTDEPDGVIVEEVVKAHPAIAQFNPDSVNTVRLVSYYNGEKVLFPSVTMRIGMKGSFVDNAGSGGISVRIDQSTGEIVTDGYRQNGVSFTSHPDSGVTFKGTQIPHWDKLLDLGREIATMVPGACYVGWDLALNEDSEWVIIEGNPIPQLFGIQSTTGTGAWNSIYDLFLKCKRNDVHEKVYLMPYAHITPSKRNIYLSDLSAQTGISYEEIYYKAMRAYAYYNIPFNVFAEEQLILKDESELEMYEEKAQIN